MRKGKKKNPRIEERNKFLAESYRKGESFRSLSIKSGISFQALRLILKKQGIEVSTKGLYKKRESISEWHRKFGMLLSEILVERVMKIEDLALEIGTTARRIADIKRGEYDLSVLQYVRICAYLGLDPKETLDGLNPGTMLNGGI